MSPRVGSIVGVDADLLTAGIKGAAAVCPGCAFIF